MKKSSKKNEVSLFEKIKTVWQDKTVRATLFFGFYFFFFLFLFINLDIDSLTVGKNNSSNNQNNETQVGNQDNSENNNVNNQDNIFWEFNTLIKDNYGYTYTINENDEIRMFNGRVSEPNILIDDYQYNYFLNLYNINQITKNSKFINKNIFQDGYQFNYEINNKSLGRLLENGNVLEDKQNTITIYTNSNMVINKVELELTNLMQELNGYSNYKIVLEYKNK